MPDAIKSCVRVCRKVYKNSSETTDVQAALARCADVITAERSRSSLVVDGIEKERQLAGDTALLTEMNVRLESDLKQAERENHSLLSRLRVVEKAQDDMSAVSSSTTPYDGLARAFPFRTEGQDVSLSESSPDFMTVTWPEFSRKLSAFSGIPEKRLSMIRWAVVDEDGVVHADTWAHILDWFVPLSDSETPTKGAYTLWDVVALLTDETFHGFASPDEITAGLLSQDSGAFCFRFSRVPGCYTLTVNANGSIGHWRISGGKKRGERTLFIDSKAYKSLFDIVRVHKKQALIIKLTGKSQKVMLGQPMKRASVKQPRTRKDPKSLYAPLTSFQDRADADTPKDAVEKLPIFGELEISD